MAIPTTTDDGGEDLLPKPDPSIPQQDPLGPRPVDESAGIDPPADPSEDLLKELDAASEQLESAGEETVEENPPLLKDFEEPEADLVPEEPESPTLDPPEIAEEVGEIEFEGFPEDDKEVFPGFEAPGDPDHLEAAPDDLERMGKEIEDFHAGKFGAPPPDGFFGGQSAGASDDPAEKLLDADYANRDAMTERLIHHTMRIELLTERLERSRL